jgi:hypothetical protein
MKRARFVTAFLLVASLGAPVAQAQKTPQDDDPGAPPSDPKAATTTTPAPSGSSTKTPAPAATTTPPPATAPAASKAPQATTGVSYTVKLHDLERKVNELKEQIFRSKARLNLLKETVLHGVIAGSRAVIMHRNEMGGTYTLVKLVYALDGAEIFAKADDGGHLGDNKEFEIFNGSIVPGNHTISVIMQYQGNGYGVFSYLKGYKFTVKDSKTFTFGEGKQTQLRVVGFEKGNPITTDPKDRPAIDFRMNVISDKASASSAAEPAAKK